jgi:uncharacterized RDD family membrane protein YckC
VSDTSQGEGWWLASDGKWYPPHDHPSVTQAPPASQEHSPSDVGAPPNGGIPQYSNAPTAFGTTPGWSGPPSYPPPTNPPPGYPGPSNYDAPPGYGTPPGYPPPGYPPPGYGPPGYPAPGYLPPGYGPPSFNPAAPGTRIDPVLNQPLAPWWKRLVAIIIDGVILGLTFFVIALVIGAAAAGHTTSNTNQNPSGGSILGAIFVLSLIGAIPSSIYYAAMNGSRRGQTVGKMALGISVRDARTGAAIGFWRALARFLITVVFQWLLYIPYILDSLAPLWDVRRQAWHDKVAHSVVVDLNP